MTVEFISSIPGRRDSSGKGRVSYVAKEIDDFLQADGERYARVTIEGREPKNMNQSFRLYLKKNPDIAEKVTVHFIGGQLYLERLDSESEE